jgi:uncharacterized membrane protein
MHSPHQRREPQRGVLMAAGLFLAIGLILQGWRIWSLNATYDQGLFLQEIWNGHLGKPFESTLASELSTPVLVTGEALPTLGYYHLGQHFTPLLMLWLPLVLLLGVWSLPLIQVALLTAGGLVLHQLAKEDLEPRLAHWIATSYFCAGIVIGPTLENFHDLCAIPLLSFSLLLGIRRKNPWLYGIPALLLPLVREDVGLLSFSFGLWMLLRQRQTWRWAGLGLCVYSALMVFTITNHVMPLFGSEVSVRFMDERFGQFLAAQNGRGSTVDALKAMLSQPLLLLQELVQPIGATLKFLITLWLPLAFLPAAGVDGWLLMTGPLFVALSSQGGNALAVNLRFVLYLVPGVFAGGILWWARHQALFHERWLKRLWRTALVLSVLFTITGNPHRSLSLLIPDSVQPWVYVPPLQQLQRGWDTRELLQLIPNDASVAAETQLVPLLAARRVLLRFPENVAYTDEAKQPRPVDWVVSQPGFNAAYAPAFERNAAWVRRSKEQIDTLLASGDYGVKRCGSSGIVLQRLATPAALATPKDSITGARCVAEQFNLALAAMQQHGDATPRRPPACTPADSGRSPATP